MRSFHFQVTATATTDGTVLLTVPTNTRVIGVLWNLMPTGTPGGAADYIYGQIGPASVFMSANEFQNILSDFGMCSGITTSGVGVWGLNGGVFGISMPYRAGEKIYCNYIESGTSSWSLRGQIWTSD